MNRILTAIAPLAFVSALAACGPVNRGLESVHQPVVHRSAMNIDLAVAGNDLAPGSAERLDAWFKAIGLTYGDRVTIDDPMPYGGAERGAAVSRVLAQYGLLLDRAPPVTTGTVASDALRVIVTRPTAEVPNCPNWDRKSQPELASSTMSNYGCAVNSNLAAMVADPEDFLSGTTYRGSEGTATVKAVDAWRKSEPTGKGGLQATDTKSLGEN
jgi:pilus assembly protein CpaD